MSDSIKDITLKDKRVLIRVDFNVPLDDKGNIAHDVRIQEALPTIHLALKQNASVILMSHFGRPTEGEVNEAFSLKKVADYLANLLGKEVHFVDAFQEKSFFKLGEIYLLENVRFNKGEKANDPALGQRYASMCDVFVLDAFSVAHRAQASTVGVAEYAPKSCAGLALAGELEMLSVALSTHQPPLVAIVGGSKVSTKFQVLDFLMDKVDVLVLGGGMANTFLRAQGHAVGSSLYEQDWCAKAATLIDKAKSLGKTLIIPVDVVCADKVSDDAQVNTYAVEQVPDNQMILDLGPKTIKIIEEILHKAKTIVWNGPMGVFEAKPFAKGTIAVAKAVAASSAFSIAGGGDTLAAIDAAGVDEISHKSSAGGAFLEYLEGRQLPGLKALNLS